MSFKLNINLVRGFAEGPPTSTCITQFPKHENAEKQQTGTPPFKITVDPASYKPSETITVGLETLQQVNKTFQGILVSAHRKSGNREEILGMFTEVQIEKMKTLSCFGGKSNVAVHKNNNPVDSLVVKWIPHFNYGDVEFRATFLENFTTFWTGITADLKASSSDMIKTADYQLPTIQPFTAINWEKCGESYGCFYHPDGCTGTDCSAGLTYKSNSDGTFTFEMEAKAEGYVSMAISKDKKMGEDESIVCTADGSRFTIQYGYNSEHYVDRQYTKGLTNVAVQKSDGKVRCRFTRRKITSLKMGEFTFNLNEPWFLQLAWGYTFIDTDVISKHKEEPIVTSSMVDLTQYNIHTTSSSTNQFYSSSLIIFVFIISSLV
ncbi:hypothetical protein LOTGIDRAFT_164312 [Lottia gigantea]|uniref:Reelin domain-containing protein n=1 Tax=Lottia gigantea TaxID=225164 RepID=V4AAS2_LOTGI|nr:hypothetical protein LOTGIDRAFT_164312 [Lottia gigantea]ESO90386.1 hypothetical protein LOTGIDRAFT_164312 [Lottia gigantea]